MSDNDDFWQYCGFSNSAKVLGEPTWGILLPDAADSCCDSDVQLKGQGQLVPWTACIPTTGLHVPAWHRSLAPPPVRPAGAPVPMYVPVSPPHAEEPKAPNKKTAHISHMTQLIIECWAAGLTQPQAALKLNMSVESLKQLCKMCNLGRWRRHYGGTEGITLECLADYKNEGLSMKEIATRHNVHVCSVQRRLRKLGIIDWTHFTPAV